MVERSLSMREVPGSIPGASMDYFIHQSKKVFGMHVTRKYRNSTMQILPTPGLTSFRWGKSMWSGMDAATRHKMKNSKFSVFHN